MTVLSVDLQHRRYQSMPQRLLVMGEDGSFSPSTTVKWLWPGSTTRRVGTLKPVQTLAISSAWRMNSGRSSPPTQAVSGDLPRGRHNAALSAVASSMVKPRVAFILVFKSGRRSCRPLIDRVDAILS